MCAHIRASDNDIPRAVLRPLQVLDLIRKLQAANLD